MRNSLIMLFCFAMMAAPAPAQEIRLATCDVLPVAEVSISGAKFLFLVDTAATSFLNSQSFARGPELRIPVTSWSGTTETRGQQVTVGDLAVGGRHLRNVRLPAVDLSAIGRACGRRLDGIFGIDLLQAFGASVQFDRGSARLLVRSEDAHDKLASFDRQFVTCAQSLSRGDENGLLGCLDQDVVLATADADFYGLADVLEFLRQKYRVRDPSTQLSMTILNRHILGEGMWTEYDLRVAVLDRVVVQRGSALWHEIDGQWRALYVNQSGLPRKESRYTSN
jgi:Aspartyl protease